MPARTGEFLAAFAGKLAFVALDRRPTGSTAAPRARILFSPVKDEAVKKNMSRIRRTFNARPIQDQARHTIYTMLARYKRPVSKRKKPSLCSCGNDPNRTHLPNDFLYDAPTASSCRTDEHAEMIEIVMEEAFASQRHSDDGNGCALALKATPIFDLILVSYDRPPG